MGSRVVAASLLLSLAASSLAQAQYFQARPFAASQRNPALRAPDGVASNSAAASVLPSDQDQRGEAADDNGLYRTLCVRLCDGYYFPLSFSTRAGGFARDAARCAASCGRQARLFYHANPGGSVETMMDLAGRPYSALPAAFRYRASLVSGCGCYRLPASEDGGEGLPLDGNRQPSNAMAPWGPGPWDRALRDAAASPLRPAPEAIGREMSSPPARSRRPAVAAPAP
jgi:hypothetical protein